MYFFFKYIIEELQLQCYILAGGQLKNVMSDGQLLLNYLYSRHSPAEQNELMEKKEQNRVELEKKCRYILSK